MKLFYGSSYDRGLDVLLFMWPDIISKYPDSELHVCYGWDLFLKIASNNPERMEWYEKVSTLLKQTRIVHHGRVGKEELKKIRNQCQIWAYPTYFEEIDCITAKECQADGLVPVTMAFGALKETAKHGILIEGDIHELSTVHKYLDELLGLMGDKKRLKQLSHKCQKWALKQSWTAKANEWLPVFNQKQELPKVTVYTPTIRDGFWNLMADNLSKQTHKNFEWIIVDGQKESRQEIATKYAKKYNLDIKYIHQPKHRRIYGLSEANNIAFSHATGEHLIALQDFILIQPTSIEEMVREAVRHPGDLIAPVDVYYKPSIQPDIKNKEDWFNGKVEIVGEYLRKNIRIQNKGLRSTDNPYDFELNIGLIPMSTLKELNGWWEFMGDALGFDNTEIAWRALQLGHKIWIDEWNIAVCIDHWEVVGNKESGHNRTRLLNDPRYYWLLSQTAKNNLPLKRDNKTDQTISLTYEIPEDVTDEGCKNWIRKNCKDISDNWGDV